jgi:hypothetical protein
MFREQPVPQCQHDAQKRHARTGPRRPACDQRHRIYPLHVHQVVSARETLSPGSVGAAGRTTATAHRRPQGQVHAVPSGRRGPVIRDKLAAGPTRASPAAKRARSRQYACFGWCRIGGTFVSPRASSSCEMPDRTAYDHLHDTKMRYLTCSGVSTRGMGDAVGGCGRAAGRGDRLRLTGPLDLPPRCRPSPTRGSPVGMSHILRMASSSWSGDDSKDDHLGERTAIELVGVAHWVLYSSRAVSLLTASST